jgi:hypothetical protein
MKLKGLVPGLDPDDLGKYLKKELKEGISPVLEKADSLRDDLNRLIEVMERIEAVLKKLEPLANLIRRIPFLR